MNHDLQARFKRWQWLLNYRLAAMDRTAKLLLIAALASQGLMIGGLLTQEQKISELRHSLQRDATSEVAIGQSAAERKRQLLDEFHAFLPSAEQLPTVAASLHAAATEAGISLEKLSSQGLGDRPASIVHRQALRLQVSGEQGRVERFILLALLESDALLLRRWAYQASNGRSAASILDFEILLKP